MDIKELLEKNREYNKIKENMEKQLKIMRSSIEELNSEINFEDIKELGYDNAKEVFEEIKYNLDYKTLRLKFEEILKELKENKYPQMKQAHFFPILNNIDFLTKKQIKALDEYLYYHPRVRISDQYYIRMWHDCGIENQAKKIIDFMYKNDMLNKRYIITCGYCDDGDSEEISKEKYENMKKYFQIQTKFKNKEDVSPEDENWFEDFDIYEEGFPEIYCECGCREIEEWSDIEDNLSFEYRLKVEADTTYAKK